MADKQARSKRRKKNDSWTKFNELSLDDVLAIGGDEEIFEMVKDVDVSSDFVADDGPPEDVDKKEIMSYIKQLGLNEHHHMSHRNDLKEILEGDKNSADQPKEVAVSKTGVENHGQKEKKGKSQRSKAIGKMPSTTTVPVVPVSESKLSSRAHSASVRKRPPHQKMLMKNVALWTDQMPEVKGKNPDLSQTDVAQLQEEALVLLENEVQMYEKDKAKDKSTDSQWLKSVVSSGTLKDKVAALTVQIQESPIHRLKTLDILLSMAKKKGRRESIIAVDMLKELWMTLLLPENRKLKTFRQNPLSSLQNVVQCGGGWDERDRKLILWFFEEQLKERFKEFIEVVERLLHDTLVKIRSKSLGVVYDLLSEKPEQEQVLLSLLINKIGDPDRKVASKAVYLARCLVTKHPNMKSVVTKEIEKLLYRPNVAIKAQYFAVCFLNQLILTKKDKELATRLISVYFSFFGTFLKKGDLEAKMLSALLTGVNRAFPYAKEEDEKYNQQLDTLFRAVHIGTFNTGVQALMLLYQVMESRQSVSDRFYQALYAKLLDPNLKTSSKQAMFLNVLYKSLKSDPSLCRVKAFVKRILQACSFQQPSFICGTLFMISELTKLKPGIRSLTQHPEEKDDEEHFVDAPDDSDLNKDTNPNNEDFADKTSRHVDIPEDQQIGSHIAKAQLVHAYKPHLRNPLYSGAENSCLWELNRLAGHYHPSVCHFASTLINSDVIEYNGDPLQDFTLMRFLDRFVYKNPKQKERDHGGSLMQPRKTSSRLKEEPVNSKAFVTKKEENVREDEVFFHRYFKQKAQKENLKKKDNKRKDDQGSDEEKTNFDNIQESANQQFDFASVLKSKAPVLKKNKSKKGEDKDDGDEETDEQEEEDGSEEDDHVEQENGSLDDEFDYEAMELSSAEEDEGETGSNKAAKRKFTDKDYEKALLDNLSSDEFSDDESQTKKSKKNRGETDVSSMFASAEKFAHLLENSQASRGGSYDVMRNGASDKQLKWEDKKAGKLWRKGENWGRGRAGRQGQASKRRNFNNRKRQNKFVPKGRGVRSRR